MRRLLIATALAALLTACSSTTEATAPEGDVTGNESTGAPSPTPEDTETADSAAAEEQALRDAVTAYSDAFLDGDAAEAYRLLSASCQKQYSLSYFTGIVTAASDVYGKALPIRTYEAKISDDLALVTYTYDVPALNQTKEPWGLDQGGWRNEQC